MAGEGNALFFHLLLLGCLYRVIKKNLLAKQSISISPFWLFSMMLSSLFTKQNHTLIKCENNRVVEMLASSLLYYMFYCHLEPKCTHVQLSVG